MKKKLKDKDSLYMVLLGLCVIMVGIAIGKTRLYGMWNGDLTCNILRPQQEEQIAEGSDNTTLQEKIEQEDKMMYENKKKLKQNAK